MSSSGDPNDNAGNSRTTIAAAIAVALLIGGGWWLMSALQHHRDVQNCIDSGRRDCVPIESGK